MANGAILGQSMSPVPDPLDFDPSVAGGYAAPIPGPMVLGQAPPPPAPAPAAPSGRTGLDYYTFGIAGDIGRGLQRVGAAAMGLPAPGAAAPAPRGTSAGGIGLGVLPVDKLPTQTFTGIGSQYLPPAPAAAPGGPEAAPVGAPAGVAAPAAPAARVAAPGGGAGGMTEVERIQVEGLKGKEEALKGQELNLRKEAAAARAALTGIEEAEQAAQTEREQATALAREQARAADLDAASEREIRRMAVEDTQRKLEAAQNALDNTKIDVDKAYGGAAGRIFAGLAVALGSFGASLTGGPNYAMQIVDQRINRELDAQRTELDKAKGKVSELGRVLQQNENLLGDASKARDLTRAQTYRALIADIDERKKGAELTPQQARVRSELEAKLNGALANIQSGLLETQTQKQLIPAIGRQQRAAAAATAARAASKEERETRKAITLELVKQGQLTIDPATGALVQGAGTPETQEKLVNRTTNLVKTLDEKNLLTGPESMATLMQAVGVDPTTGAKSGAGSVAGFSFGGTVRDPFAVTAQAKEIRRQIGEQVESVAKASGGVITDSDRAGALARINGSGSISELQNALVDFYGKYASKARSFAAADPVAFQVVAKSNPALAAVVNFGQARQAATAAGLRSGAK